MGVVELEPLPLLLVGAALAGHVGMAIVTVLTALSSRASSGDFWKAALTIRERVRPSKAHVGMIRMMGCEAQE